MLFLRNENNILQSPEAGQLQLWKQHITKMLKRSGKKSILCSKVRTAIDCDDELEAYNFQMPCISTMPAQPCILDLSWRDSPLI
jgi:hypothetical protein